MNQGHYLFNCLTHAGNNKSMYTSPLTSVRESKILLYVVRRFEPSYNCTKGLRLMNETRVSYDSNNVTTTVYTDYRFDLPKKVSRQILMGEDQLYPGDKHELCLSFMYEIQFPIYCVCINRSSNSMQYIYIYISMYLNISKCKPEVLFSRNL